MKPNPKDLHDLYLGAFINHGMTPPAEEVVVTMPGADGGYAAQPMPHNPQVLVPQLRLQPRKG